MNRRITIALLATISALAINAQKPPVFKRTPLQTAELVGDKFIRNTPFQYQYIYQKPSSQLNEIKFINFGRTFGNNKAAVAYALTAIESPVDTTVTMELSHSDGLKIWVNNKLAYHQPGNGMSIVHYKERAIDLAANFPLPLKKGTNQILIKSETAGKHWQLYLRAKGSPRNLVLSLSKLPLVDSSVSSISNWLVIGPFPNKTENGKRTGLDKTFEPETNFSTATLYDYEGEQISWTIPQPELSIRGTGPLLAWGDNNFSWNYHAAGSAWGMAHLSAYSGKPKYEEHAKKYADFFINKKPFLSYLKYELGGLDKGDTKIRESRMLDFSGAPALVYTYFLLKEKDFPERASYQSFYNEIKQYVVKEQVRLPDGTFTRNTPHQYTTWTDDMYMGIPFLVYSSLLTKDAAEKKSLMEDAVNQIFTFNKQVWDAGHNLYRQAQYSDIKIKIPFWSRANGWGLWAVTEVLAHLPKNHPKYKEVLAHYRTHINTLIRHQDSTGFWHNLIDYPDTFLETSGTAIFTMAIARGINNGWLDRKKYLPAALKGWKAIESVVDNDGTLHGTCIGTNMSENVRDYYTRPVADDDTHGILPVLFAGIEMDKLINKK